MTNYRHYFSNFCPIADKKERNIYLTIKEKTGLVIDVTVDTGVGEKVGVAVDGAGNVFMMDPATGRIEKYTSDGTLIARWGFESPEAVQPNRGIGVSVDGAGNVFLLDAEKSRIQKYSSDGRLIGAWGFGEPAQSASEKTDSAPEVPGKGVDTAKAATSAVTGAATDVAGKGVDTAKAATSAVTGAATDVAGKGVDTAKAATSAVTGAATGVVGKGVDVAKAAGGFASAPGDGLKQPVKPKEEKEKKRPWWKFW
ncbi:MAG: hypothetical protein AB7S61_03520 [Methanoregulaceae archaeon]